MAASVNLANKSQLLIGFAVVVIIIGTLAVPWTMTNNLVAGMQTQSATQIAAAWLEEHQMTLARGEVPPGGGTRADIFADPDTPTSGLRTRYLPVEDIDTTEDATPFESQAARRFLDDAQRDEIDRVTEVNDQSVHQYARAIRERDLARVETDESGQERRELLGVLLIERPDNFARGRLLTARVFIVAAGVIGSLLAIAVFYFILKRLILSPVRELRGLAERVERGEMAARASINTGDELEQLGDAFNNMLTQVEQQQLRLRRMNETMELKVDQLEEANIGLDRANKVKSEFLASVSHELRTPLNSIVGFAELLEEQARDETEGDSKRVRYLNNIVTSGKALRQMIDDLLDMAKIEAGRVELSIEPTSIADVVEGLAAIMRPQCEAKQIIMHLDVSRQVPTIETDPGKLQQILFNFVSNAVKFTPSGGRIAITADRVTRHDNTAGVRVAVADSGPGIAEDMQDIIFDKFRQVDASHTREHAGTGLGLAICRELANMLGGEVSFVSDPGHGATFFVDLPQAYRAHEPQPLMGDRPSIVS